MRLHRNTLPRATHRAEIGPFYVIPKAQGSGAATALMDAAFAHARNIGVRQVELAVNENNPRAKAVYQRLGFYQIGRIPNAIHGTQGPERDLLFALHLPRAVPHLLERSAPLRYASTNTPLFLAGNIPARGLKSVLEHPAHARNP